MKHWPKNVDAKILITCKWELKAEFLKMNESYYIIMKEKMYKENIIM